MASHGTTASSSVMKDEETIWNTSVTDKANASYHVNIGNSTEDLDKDPLISLRVPAAMFASGVIGNLLAIFVLVRSSREHKQTVFYRLVGALACTDLFGTCATSPVTIAVYLNKFKWVGGEALCNYESFMLIFAGYSTICIIGTMAVDRFLAITYPFFYDNHITVGRAKFIIVGIWLFAAFMGCLPIMGLGENVKQFPGTWCFFVFTSSKIKNQIFAYLYAVIGLLVIVVTAISNVVVTFVLLKMRRKAIRTMSLSNAKRNDSELQMMVLLLGIIVVFATCWCPFLIRILVNQANKRLVDVKADLHALRLASFNQILDPWIYILFRKELLIRTIRCFKLVVFSRCRCNCKDGLSGRCVSFEERNGNHDKSRHVSFLKQDSDYVHIADENEINDNFNHQQHGKDIERTKLNSSESNSSSFSTNFTGNNTSGDEITDETRLLTTSKEHITHGHHLHLKHSACLFCLSNHPRTCVLSAISESRSMEEIHLADGGSRLAEMNKKKGSGLNFLNKGRRDSIHLSLEDVSLRRDECLTAGSSDDSINC